MSQSQFPRMHRLPPYVFAVVNELKMQLRRQGVDIVDLGMGNPDMPTPQHIVDKMVEASMKGNNHRYSVSRGIPNLRKAICDWYTRRFGVYLDPDTEAVVTMGAKEGLSHLSLAMLSPGDVVFAPDPTYPIHMLAVLDGAPDEFARLFDAAHEFDEHVDFRVVRKDGGVVREAGPVRQVTRLRKVAYQHMLHLNGTPRALDDPLAVLFEDAQEAAAHGAATGHADDQRFHAILHRACRTAGGVCRAGPASCAVRSR